VRIEGSRGWDGKPLPPHLKTEITSAVERLELIQKQIV